MNNPKNDKKDNNDKNENNDDINDNINSNKNIKFLNKKRKPQFSLEEIINIYCKQHNIADNEISEKIRTIYYHNPEQNILIDYNKDKGDKFPLSRHIHHNKKEKNIYLQDDFIEEKEENKKEKKKINEKGKKKEEKEKEKEKKEEETCFVCGWKFLKELSIEEKNRHINLCIEGKGEENIKELISTYKELENFKNNQEEQINENNNNEENFEEDNKEEGDDNKNDD